MGHRTKPIIGKGANHFQFNLQLLISLHHPLIMWLGQRHSEERIDEKVLTCKTGAGVSGRREYWGLWGLWGYLASSLSHYPHRASFINLHTLSLNVFLHTL